MKLNESRKIADYFTRKASEVTRQLAFSGIAVIWIFKNTSTRAIVPDDMLLPLFLLVVALGSDFLHYALGGVEWTAFNFWQEKKHGGTDGEVTVDDAPRWLNWPHGLFYWLKLGSLVLSYIFLVRALGSRL